MGYLYVKVIESKKVAVRNSFFVNYPFVRVKVGKEKKSTNFKPGVEWWDKIFTFKAVSRNDHQQIIIQARDKSIHVFGSDWLGEVKIDLDTEGYLDERVHQMWFKFGRGKNPHSRSPRGYVHLAFQYSEELVVGKRPFSTAPVEKVLTFEEWLAANNRNWASDSSMWFPETTEEPGWKLPDPLRQSAPAVKSNGLSPDEVRPRSNTSPRSPPDQSINPTQKHEERKFSNTKQRSMTMPDVRSPSAMRKKKEIVESSSEEEDEDDEENQEPRLGNLIDFSFDAPKNKMGGHFVPRSILKNSQNSKSLPAIPDATIDDKIEDIKRLSLSTKHSPAPEVADLGFQSDEPSFADWYKGADESKPRNPFLDMHDNFEPTGFSKN